MNTEERIKQLKERAAERAEAERVKALEDQLKRLEHEDLAATLLEEHEEKHGRGRVGVVHTDEGPVVLKCPHSATFRKFQDRAEYKTEPMFDLVLPSVLHPSRSEFEALCERLPATLARCASKVAELAGQRVQDVSGK